MKLFASILLLFSLAMSTHAAGKLEHVVSLKFKPAASAADIKKVEDAFRALKTKIPEIVSLEWGTNVSKENRDKGFTHCFILSFKNEADRDVYIHHPEHEKFKALAGPSIEDVFVIDFVARK
jgi:hypothetical protein